MAGSDELEAEIPRKTPGEHAVRNKSVIDGFYIQIKNIYVCIIPGPNVVAGRRDLLVTLSRHCLVLRFGGESLVLFAFWTRARARDCNKDTLLVFLYLSLSLSLPLSLLPRSTPYSVLNADITPCRARLYNSSLHLAGNVFLFLFIFFFIYHCIQSLHSPSSSSPSSSFFYTFQIRYQIRRGVGGGWISNWLIHRNQFHQIHVRQGKINRGVVLFVFFNWSFKSDFYRQVNYWSIKPVKQGWPGHPIEWKTCIPFDDFSTLNVCSFK